LPLPLHAHSAVVQRSRASGRGGGRHAAPPELRLHLAGVRSGSRSPVAGVALRRGAPGDLAASSRARTGAGSPEASGCAGFACGAGRGFTQGWFGRCAEFVLSVGSASLHAGRHARLRLVRPRGSGGTPSLRPRSAALGLPNKALQLTAGVRGMQPWLPAAAGSGAGRAVGGRPVVRWGTAGGS
jgi:hypothetical protein